MENDLFADSNGHCFFCLTNVKGLENLQELKTVHSLQYFSKYLKVDRRKVFSDDKQVSPELLEKVEKSILKVELCEKCSKLNAKCTDVLKKLEKLEMNLSHYLAQIQANLAKPVREEEFIHSEPGKFEIFDRLRNEIKQKCNFKSNEMISFHPKVQIERIADDQIKYEKFKVEPQSENYLTDYKTDADSNFTGIKRENIEWFEICENNEDVGHSNSEDNDNFDEVDRDYPQDQKIVKKPSKCHTKSFKKPRLIPPPIKIFGKTGSSRNMSEIDRKTQKTTCRVCQRKFNEYSNFHNHYNKIHLLLKWKCPNCDSTFSDQSSYTRHFIAAHLGSKFPCNFCSKEFTEKDNLIKHKKSVHFGSRYQCKFCHKQFLYDSGRIKHEKNAHSKNVQKQRGRKKKLRKYLM